MGFSTSNSSCVIHNKVRQLTLALLTLELKIFNIYHYFFKRTKTFFMMTFLDFMLLSHFYIIWMIRIPISFVNKYIWDKQTHQSRLEH
jgi:hypothetical protein